MFIGKNKIKVIINNQELYAFEVRFDDAKHKCKKTLEIPSEFLYFHLNAMHSVAIDPFTVNYLINIMGKCIKKQ